MSPGEEPIIELKFHQIGGRSLWTHSRYPAAALRKPSERRTSQSIRPGRRSAVIGDDLEHGAAACDLRFARQSGESCERNPQLANDCSSLA